jgi:excisionase family DNA binding protein
MSLVLIEKEELQTIISNSVTNAINAALVKRENPFSHLPEFLTRHQASEVLGVCLATLDNWARLGKIEKERLGGRTVRFRKTDLLEKKGMLLKHSR